MELSLSQFWQRLYARHKAELIAYLQIQWRQGPDQAADITHEAFERFMLVAEPHSVEQPRAYLFRLVRNLCVDTQRRARVRQTHADQVTQCGTGLDHHSPEHRALGAEQLRELERAITRLPAKQRRAFVLARVHQCSYEEIAGELGISKEGVKKHVMRALEACETHMRQKFEDWS